MLTAVNKLQDITFFPPHPPFILLLFSLPAGVVRFDPCSHILQPRNGARNSAAISASLLLHNNPALRAFQETSSLKPLPGKFNTSLQPPSAARTRLPYRKGESFKRSVAQAMLQWQKIMGFFVYLLGASELTKKCERLVRNY